MPISKETIDKIHSQVDIVELISEYVPNLKRSGKDYKALCPFHSERTPSFFVSPSKNIFHCFGCKVGGDVIKFIMQIENLTYPEAVNKLAKRIGIEIKEVDEEISTEKKLIFELLTNAAQFYHKYLTETSDGEIARRYLIKRGVKQTTIEKFHLGYAPDGNKLTEKAIKKYSQEILLKSGLVCISETDLKPFDLLRNRIVFPIFDLSGQVIAFGGRALNSTQQPVYLNTSDTVVFSKSKTLYGMFQAKPAINKSKKIIFTEGYFDVILTHQFGIENTVAPLGTAVTVEHLKFIRRFAEEVFFLFDSDESGKQAAIRAGESCIEAELNSKIVLLPEGTDPDEFVLQFGAEKLKEIINQGINPVEFKVNYYISKFDISNPEDKSKFVKNILETVIKIRDPVLRQEMIKYISVKSGVEEGIIISEIRKLTGRKKIDAKESILLSSELTFHSIEEEILALCLKYPQIVKDISIEVFEDERCRKVISQLKLNNKDFSYVKILNSLDEDTASWLIQIAFEEIEYSSPPEIVLSKLLNALNLQRQEERRRQLEIEVIPMWEGKAELDIEKVQEYERLTKLLKSK